MIGLFGVVPEPSHSLDDLIELYKRPTFIIYFSLIELTVVSLLVGNRIVERMLKHNASVTLAAHRRAESTATNLSSLNLNNIHHSSDRYNKLLGGIGIGAGRSIGKMNPMRIKTLLGISYGCVSGMLSSQALLFAKSAIELLMLTILQGQNQFHSPLSWFLVMALITAALLQLYYLNKGLRLCDTVLLVPLSFCAYNVSCLFNGLVYYNQWGRLYWWQILLVLFGISQVLIGVLVLAWRPAAMGDDYGDEDSDGDEATLLLPNGSRPTTPRHSRVFSFKGVVPGTGSGGHTRQDSSVEARDLIQGFEMYDSDEDEVNNANHTGNNSNNNNSGSREQEEQDQRLVVFASENTQSEVLPPPLQTPKTNSLAKHSRGSK
ncbi:hypothetical protein BGX28_008240 [Mortierella sp. GBA30]|nr:hypothetical protein BGX28_008240 [Mortierella sp. GBA30]